MGRIIKQKDEKLLFTRAHPKKCCHCEPVRTLAWQSPGFSENSENEEIVYRSSLKSWGIATPVCGLVRNDIFFFSAVYNNLPKQ